MISKIETRVRNLENKVSEIQDTVDRIAVMLEKMGKYKLEANIGGVQYNTTLEAWIKKIYEDMPDSSATNIPYLKSFEFNASSKGNWNFTDEVYSQSGVGESTKLIWSVDDMEKITKGIGTALLEIDKALFVPETRYSYLKSETYSKSEIDDKLKDYLKKIEVNDRKTIYNYGERLITLSFDSIVKYCYYSGMGLYCSVYLDGEYRKFTGIPMYSNGQYVIQSPIYDNYQFNLREGNKGDSHYVQIDTDFVRLIHNETGNVVDTRSPKDAYLYIAVLEYLTNIDLYANKDKNVKKKTTMN